MITDGGNGDDTCMCVLAFFCRATQLPRFCAWGVPKSVLHSFCGITQEEEESADDVLKENGHVLMSALLRLQVFVVVPRASFFHSICRITQ